MKTLLAALIGGVAGFLAGYALLQLLASFLGLNTPAAQVLVGTIAGGFVGALVAGIMGGDMNAAADDTGVKALMGFVLGAVGGALGSSEFRVVDWVLQLLR